MATNPADCVNYDLNLLMCPCTSDKCGNRGICCECMQAHHAKQGLTACMRGAKRDPDTLTLSTEEAAKCATNQARNLEFCVCKYDTCERKGVCCNCVRNTFDVEGLKRVACMEGF